MAYQTAVTLNDLGGHSLEVIELPLR